MKRTKKTLVLRRETIRSLDAGRLERTYALAVS
jgi:hypothetical protein